MTEDFTFNPDKPPILVKDSEFARTPSGPLREFLHDRYSWDCHISRWRRKDTFPEGDDFYEVPEVGGVWFDLFDETDAAIYGQLKEQK